MAAAIWTCPGHVIRVHDGDTVLCEIDLGWQVSIKSLVRIDGLASPELSTQAGKDARDFAAKLLPPLMPVTIVSKKLLGRTEKYGRVLADLSFDVVEGTVDYAEVMIAAGKGVAWDGTGKQPT